MALHREAAAKKAQLCMFTINWLGQSEWSKLRRTLNNWDVKSVLQILMHQYSFWILPRLGNFFSISLAQLQERRLIQLLVGKSMFQRYSLCCCLVLKLGCGLVVSFKQYKYFIIAPSGYLLIRDDWSDFKMVLHTYYVLSCRWITERLLPASYLSAYCYC